MQRIFHKIFFILDKKGNHVSFSHGFPVNMSLQQAAAKSKLFFRRDRRYARTTSWLPAPALLVPGKEAELSSLLAICRPFAIWRKDFPPWLMQAILWILSNTRKQGCPMGEPSIGDIYWLTCPPN
jgi:hypothetical protein